jgi:hypothetical protein
LVLTKNTSSYFLSGQFWLLGTIIFILL